MSTHPTVLVIGGTAGTGKSTIGESLVNLLRLKYPNAQFLEGDRLHSKQNIEKMSNGIPLCDEDRWDWLERISTESTLSASANDGLCIITCSALKLKYRNYIIDKNPNTIFFFLMVYASPKEILMRLTRREGHFMKANMLNSQFADLELPINNQVEPHSRVVTVDGRLEHHVLLETFDVSFELLRSRSLKAQILEIFELYKDERNPCFNDKDFKNSLMLDLIINELSWVNVATIKSELHNLVMNDFLEEIQEGLEYKLR
ncbi:uncharacterized protein HGUI_02804 [Hanseniaspora guilliermondii]|uniref:Gluconokinase n=1 Tax=Hanseniaspora guilliermondii TaxID=56406 RepID=A0A1L0B470_9ASCO|nr:uncharacterized protein HGUI_02804 [Hanseniaspora guilliermondii]